MTSHDLTLTGQLIRLEPLRRDHIGALAAASAALDPSMTDPEIYSWTVVPQGIDEMTRYVETALEWRDAGTAIPFAVVRLRDEAVIGSTRYWNIERWAWPADSPRHGNPYPDTCEIGWTWYSRPAIRSGANSEGKFLMLQHAFEVWKALRVCLNTDSRNRRSQAAMERIGFKHEGVLRAHKLAADGIPRDSYRYSMIAAEWPEAKQRLLERMQH
ncbi:MAG: GNAT family N-acetyltransferase [Acidobacteriaceae bacterium]